MVAIVPTTENLVGPAALKPGDVITHYNGKTVEVVNTDAEGRLILADALAYGIEQYQPAAVVDMATLTGAVIIGLGHHRTGLLSNDDQLVERITAAGERSGEPVWQLPLGKEYTKQLESKVADLKNVGNRDAGTITAASFLKEFVGDTPGPISISPARPGTSPRSRMCPRDRPGWGPVVVGNDPQLAVESAARYWARVRQDRKGMHSSEGIPFLYDTCNLTLHSPGTALFLRCCMTHRRPSSCSPAYTLPGPDSAVSGKN